MWRWYGVGKQDASWLLPSSSPLKCTSPADVYMLLKSSDFVTHDISEENVFAGCVPNPAAADEVKYELELVLRKWYAVDRSRELRCFVRGDVLLGLYPSFFTNMGHVLGSILTHFSAGISQRDTNHYDFLNDPPTQRKIVSSVSDYWEKNVKAKWTGVNACASCLTSNLRLATHGSWSTCRNAILF